MTNWALWQLEEFMKKNFDQGLELKKSFAKTEHVGSFSGVFLVQKDDDEYVLRFSQIYHDCPEERKKGLNFAERERKALSDMAHIQGVVDLVEEYEPITDDIGTVYAFLKEYAEGEHQKIPGPLQEFALKTVREIHECRYVGIDISITNFVVNRKEDKITIFDLDQYFRPESCPEKNYKSHMESDFKFLRGLFE